MDETKFCYNCGDELEEDDMIDGICNECSGGNSI